MLKYTGGKIPSAVKNAIRSMSIMPKVQLGKSGSFFNVKGSCPHGTLYIVNSGVYKYAICKLCGKNMGEVDIPSESPVQGKGKKGS